MDSLRFNGSTTGNLHARSVPPVQDYDRRVMVGVPTVPARYAQEDRLAFATVSGHGPAGRAGLGRIGRVDADNSRRFVGEHGLNLMPPDVKDGSVQAALLGDVPSGEFDGTFCARRHRLSAKLFDNDSPVPAGNGGCRLVSPMFPNASLLRSQRRNSALCFLVTNGPTFPSAGNALSFPNALFQNAYAYWKAVRASIAQHQGYGDASVNSDRAAGVSHIAIDKASNGNLPTKRCLRNRNFAYLAFHWARQAKLDPSNLRKPDLAPFGVDLLHQDFSSTVAKGFVGTLLLKIRVATLTLPSKSVGTVQRLKCALQGGDVDSSDKIDLSPEQSEFSGLGHIVQVVPCTGLVAPPMVPALFQGEVPDKPARPRKLRHRGGLVWRRAQNVAEASVHNSLI